jgi:hypothetical protein
MYTRQTNQHAGSEKPLQDKYDRFETWLRENGGNFDLVSND